MSIVLQKGEPLSAEFASTDFPTLDENWVGHVSLYTTYPGIAVFTKALVLVLVGNKLTLDLTIGEILALDSTRTYSFVVTIENPVLGISITSVDYASVRAIAVYTGAMCLITMNIMKSDGTPAGIETKVQSTSVDGPRIITGWQGIAVTAKLAAVANEAGQIIDTENITVITDATGYAELAVIKGLTVTFTSPAFGRVLTVDTAGHDTIDLSSVL